MPCVQTFFPVWARGLCILCCLFLLVQPCLAEPPLTREPKYGTFMQLYDKNRNWSAAQWEDVFALLQQMNIIDIVVPWSASDRDSFEPLLPTLLDAAERHGIQMWIGLRNDSGWWKSITMPTRFVEIYLWKLMNIQMVIADRLIRNHGLHTAFAGIYLPLEIGDTAWIEEDKRAALKGVLYQFSKRLEIEHPGINVAMSGFAEGIATPEQTADLWHMLITAGNLKRVYFRSNAGRHPLEPEAAIVYLKALQANLPSRKVHLIAVVEHAVHPQEISERTGLRTEQPTPAVARLRKQVELTRAAGLENISFYNMLEYMTAIGSLNSQQLRMHGLQMP